MRTTAWQDQELVTLLLQEMSIELDASIVIGWVGDNYAPEDVFSEDDLATWAMGHGYVEEED